MASRTGKSLRVLLTEALGCCVKIPGKVLCDVVPEVAQDLC